MDALESDSYCAMFLQAIAFLPTTDRFRHIKTYSIGENPPTGLSSTGNDRPLAGL